MSDSKRDYITVVSGLPRSGTSMMMRMLASGGIPLMTDGFRQADDDNPHGYYEFEAVKRMDKDASWLSDAYGKAIKVIYVLLRDLPEDHKYRVIFMKRSLDEVIASQNVMLQRRQEVGPLSDEKLMQLFDQQLQKLFAWIGTRKNFMTLYLDYQEVLDEPETSARAIAGFLGLPLDVGAMTRAVDPSLHRNRSEALL